MAPLGILHYLKILQPYTIMEKKDIIKLGLAVVLIAAGTVLKNSALKEKGDKLIK